MATELLRPQPDAYNETIKVSINRPKPPCQAGSNP